MKCSGDWIAAEVDGRFSKRTWMLMTAERYRILSLLTEKELCPLASPNWAESEPAQEKAVGEGGRGTKPEKGGEAVWKPFSRRILIIALVSEKVQFHRLLLSG